MVSRLLTSAFCLAMTALFFGGFAAAEPITLHVLSAPIDSVPITGTQEGTTPYSFEVGVLQAVSITAPAVAYDGDVRYDFVKWSFGDSETTNLTVQFTITQDTTATAIYQIRHHTVEVETAPVSGISITGSGLGETPYTFMVDDQQPVTLEAPLEVEFEEIPYGFARWVINGTVYSEGENAVEFVPEASYYSDEGRFAEDAPPEGVVQSHLSCWKLESNESPNWQTSPQIWRDGTLLVTSGPRTGLVLGTRGNTTDKLFFETSTPIVGTGIRQGDSFKIWNTVANDKPLNVSAVALYAFSGNALYANGDEPANGMAAGDDNNFGLSPEQPTRTISRLLEYHPYFGYGKTIHVGPGVFNENVVVNSGNSGLTLVGSGEETVIHSNNTEPCLKIVLAQDVVLSGLTFRNGPPSPNAAVSAISSCITIIGNLFTGNRGISIYLSNSSANITDNLFTDNIGTGIHLSGSFSNITGNCSTGGGGIYVSKSAAFINFNTLTGCGIYSYDSSPVISSNTIAFNVSSDYGGIYSENGSIVITGNIIAFNTATSSAGGGIRVKSGSPQISGNTIAHNVAATSGGGIHCESNTAMIDNNIIVHNSCFGERAGGGVSLYCTGSSVIGNLIAHNMAPCGYGGGLFSGTSNVVQGNIITQNQARRGGGIGFHRYPNPYFAEARFSKNEITANYASISGGGIYGDWDLLVLTQTLIAGNTASGVFETRGGSIDAEEGDVVLDGCTIVDNSASTAGAIYATESVSINNSIIRSNSAPHFSDGSAFAVTYSNIEGGFSGEGNIDVDPLFADTLNGDYHLMSQHGRWDPAANDGEGGWVYDDATSPCIATGDTASDFSNEPHPNGGRVNMGAYGNTQFASKAGYTRWLLEADTTFDCSVDHADLIFVRNRLGNSAADGDNCRADANDDGKIDLLDLIYVRNRQGAACGE